MNSPLKLDCLPAEILISIRLLLYTDPLKVLGSWNGYVEYEWRKSFSPQSQSQLQLVNCRFRQLELDIPELWTHVDIKHMNLDRILLQLQRSKKLELSLWLDLVIHPWNMAFTRCMCERLAIVSSHAHRWTYCAVVMSDMPYVPNGDAANGEHICFDTLRGASFPSVTFLDLLSAKENAVPVIKTWSFENLKYLRIREIGNRNIYPRYSSLDTLSWDIHFHSFWETSFMRAFEPVALTLRCLRIKWTNVECYGQPEAHVILQSLKEFALIDDKRENDPARILQLLQRISMPVLATLSLNIHISICCTGEFLPWLSSLKNPELKSVDVVVAEAKHHAQFGNIIREVFIKEARLKDRAVEVTMESDSKDESEDEPEYFYVDDLEEVYFEDDTEDGDSDCLR